MQGSQFLHPTRDGSDTEQAADISVRERILATLDRIDQRDGRLHAFVEVDADGALRRADALDRLPPAQRGALHGVPVAIKEIIDVAGRLCAWGSRLHAGRRPARNAVVVQRLLQAGAVVIGITASTEYALAAPAATVHPLDALRSPGASSSGSAAAVAAGLVPLALGSQTIGSTIRPAAYCGVVGFKPSHRRYPTQGTLCLSERLDDVGLLADSVHRVVVADRVLADLPTSAPAQPTSGLCIVPPWFDEPLSDAMQVVLQKAHARLRGHGAAPRILRVDAWIAAEEQEITDVVLTGELARHHGAALCGAPARVSQELMDMVQRGQGLAPARLAWAASRQARVADRLNALLGPGEIALAPATTGTAPLLTEGSGSRAPQRLWTLAGMPALTLPIGFAEGLPVGIQLIARTGEDAMLLHAAPRIEALLRDPAHGR
jgi:Asp-tRNA(Asn)/Glu-tRNA(Gln) amidotransferase A subunit family amidase